MAAANQSFANASLYVGDLFDDVTEALLFEIFNAVGPVASVRVCRDASTRRSLGYAYVNYHRLEDAERALDTMNFKPIRNRPCRIMWSHRDPSLRRSGQGNIFVKNLAASIDNKSLYDTFSMFGNILSCKVSTNAKGESRGYGFVHYAEQESATQAIERVNNKVIAGKVVNVEMFKPKKERSSDTEFTNVFVKNISEDATEEMVRELFGKYGTITSMKLDAGFGFVNFQEVAEATAAVDALNDLEWSGKKLYVGRAQRKQERERELKEKFDALKAERQKKYEGTNLYVKNLNEVVDEEKLTEAFKVHGTVSSAKIMSDAAGKSKGFGFISFASAEDAAKAQAEMNGKMLEGKPLYVAVAERKDVRRQKLEMQHGKRQGMPMYAQGGPVFYAQGMPPRNFMMQPMMRRGYPGPGPGPMMSPRGPANYSLMPVPQQQQQQQQRQGPGGRGGGRGNRRGQQNGQQPNGQRRQQPQQMPRQPEAQQAPPSAVLPSQGGAVEPLTIKALAAAPAEDQKQMIGERLFPLVKNRDAVRAPKITGMLLEMDNGELLHLLENSAARAEKIAEAIAVLDAAGAH